MNHGGLGLVCNAQLSGNPVSGFRTRVLEMPDTSWYKVTLFALTFQKPHMLAVVCLVLACIICVSQTLTALEFLEFQSLPALTFWLASWCMFIPTSKSAMQKDQEQRELSRWLLKKTIFASRLSSWLLWPIVH